MHAASIDVVGTVDTLVDSICSELMGEKRREGSMGVWPWRDDMQAETAAGASSLVHQLHDQLNVFMSVSGGRVC